MQCKDYNMRRQIHIQQRFVYDPYRGLKNAGGSVLRTSTSGLSTITSSPGPKNPARRIGRYRVTSLKFVGVSSSIRASASRSGKSSAPTPSPRPCFGADFCSCCFCFCDDLTGEASRLRFFIRSPQPVGASSFTRHNHVAPQNNAWR